MFGNSNRPFTRPIALAMFFSAMAGLSPASTVSLKSARINNTLIVLADSIVIFPGDYIECDAFVSDWKTDFGRLDTYQLMIDSTGLVGETSGVLRPYFYEGPIPLFNACNSNEDCIPDAVCGDTFCAPLMCTKGGCPTGQVCGSSGWCFQFIEHPLNGSREVGLLIDTQRPDFVFFNLFPLAIVDISRAPGYRWGAIPLAVRGVEDPGVPRYAGSIVLQASVAESPDGRACGDFSIGFFDDFRATFFEPPPDDKYFTRIVPNIIPLLVSVDCSGMQPLPSECNRDGFVTLAEHRHLTECLDGTALEGTCFCLDNNDDGQVDLRDFADLQNFLGAP